MPTPDRTVGRLSLYRRLLQAELDKSVTNVYSHQLASLAGVTAAQIRRDLTYVGYVGNPRVGYSVGELKQALEAYLTPDGEERLALVGVGNLGRAILDHFSGRHSRLCISASFDKNPEKTGRVILGCRCYAMDELDEVIEREGVKAAIIAVPTDQAQGVADILTMAGVRGILNFAPVSLRVKRDVYVESNDLTMAIEKVAFFAREKSASGSVATRAR